jgi:hypothetical protein
MPTKEHTLPFSKHPTFGRKKDIFNNLPYKYNRNVMLVLNGFDPRINYKHYHMYWSRQPN